MFIRFCDQSEVLESGISENAEAEDELRIPSIFFSLTHSLTHSHTHTLSLSSFAVLVS